MSSNAQDTVDDELTSSHRTRRVVSRPRPRPVLSCLRCRRRKIKCDRLLPCRQCTLTGHDKQCSYSVGPKGNELGGSQVRNGSISTQALTESVTDHGDSNQDSIREEFRGAPKSETLASIQKRLEKLERLCKTHSETMDPANHDGEANDPLLKADAALSIKTSGPRYHSQSYKKSLFHHFGIAGRFCHSGFDDPERGPVMNEIRMHHQRFSKTRRKRDKLKPASSQSSSMLEFLPSRTACDESVASYFNIFEKSMRILHYPTFIDEYQRFWQPGEMHQEFNSFIPQLTVIVGIIRTLDDVSTPDDREINADILCDHVEVWLDSLTGRRQLTLSALRTRALLVIAQQVRAVQADEVWKATGKLLRLAMMAGLHRDPSEFPDIQIFEGELRRRLWMTIVEMDLEASLIYGMPVMLRDSDFTSNAPSNIDDLDLNDGMTELPLPKPLEQSTDSIFQVALVGCLTLRLQAIGESGDQLENVISSIHALESYVQGLPSHLHLGGTNNDFGKACGIILLNVYIRRVLSYLYRSSVSLTDSAPKATSTGLNSSLSILSYQKVFDPVLLGSDSGECERYWDLFHILCKSDIMQAALDVCLHAQAPGLVSWTRAGLLLAIEDTTASLMRRISRSGSDVKDVLRLSVISQLLKSQFTQADREKLMREGASNVLIACRKAAGQDNIMTGGDEKDTRSPISPNIQLALENGNTLVDWTAMSSDPLLANNSVASFLGMDVNFDLLSDYPLDDIQNGLWNQ